MAGMAEHHASVTVNAPVHQVYGLFTHFNDFPKFMSFVKEVTYYDDQRSHWVAEVVGRHEWDAVNEGWAEDQQIGWRSTNGLENSGRVTFEPVGSNQTQVDVFISYNPPAGVLGDVGEKLGVGSRFDSVLQHDLDNFARMVDQAPPGALDPTSSNYLFHSGSAAAKGATTDRQDATMGNDNAVTANSGANYAASTGSSYSTQSDSSYTTGTSGATNTTGYPTDRPVLDRDIINEPMNIVDTGSQSGTGTTQDSLVPPDNDVARPVMPPDRDSSTSY